MAFSTQKSDFPYYGRQPVSLYNFLQDMHAIEERIPKTGVICYAGISIDGLTPRMHYVWTVYSLAPRIVVPWGNQVHEEAPGLKVVAPSLLWGGKFDETTCSYLLVHKLTSEAPTFRQPGFDAEVEFKSGRIDMVLYTREKP
ncbi:hypothetical protein [Achromobacter kerstersii]|jgi:hypothetical protein|uniref:hypothetical protein n=1 Tax=Achromobacter kerstersii TaxID=1353890 RepID=UPI00313BC606